MPSSVCHGNIILCKFDALADLDGDALHASLGLPPTLRITQARVSAMELRVILTPI